jgi:3-isopropylmalate/(R)-2-methylmalate dehydratase small subunit
MPLEPLTELRSQAHLIANSNIDTDIVYPARFLLVLDRDGIGQYAFHDWRKDADGLENPDFPAPALMEGERSVLVAGPNFGCGSSREHAVWTLADLGLRCIIAPSFGEIFYSNCFKNGVLPIPLPDQSDYQRVRDAAAADESIAVDLRAQTITLASGDSIGFEVPRMRRDALLNGWDEIDMVIEQDGDDIRAYEAQRSRELPWLFNTLDTNNP